MAGALTLVFLALAFLAYPLGLAFKGRWRFSLLAAAAASLVFFGLFVAFLYLWFARAFAGVEDKMAALTPLFLFLSPAPALAALYLKRKNRYLDIGLITFCFLSLLAFLFCAISLSRFLLNNEANVTALALLLLR